MPYFCEKSKCYKDGTHRLKGIRSLLADWYWPHTPKQKGGGCRFGQRIGRQVDRELTTWVKEGGYLPKSVHPYTTKLVSFFQEMKWRPVAAQYVVGGVAFGSIGTALDLVMRNAENELLILEIKCGFDGYWQEAKDDMKGLSKVANTPCHQAMAQLLFGHLLLIRTQPLRPKHAYVVNVNKTGVRTYSAKECEWGRELLKDLEQKVLARKSRVPAPPRIRRRYRR